MRDEIVCSEQAGKVRPEGAGDSERFHELLKEILGGLRLPSPHSHILKHIAYLRIKSAQEGQHAKARVVRTRNAVEDPFLSNESKQQNHTQQ